MDNVDAAPAAATPTLLRAVRRIPKTEAMAENAIGCAGLYFDELNKIRVLEPEVAVQTTDLKDECKDFLESELNLVLTYVS